MTSIIVKFNFPLVHKYLDAGQNTEYLKNLHRHLIYIEVKMQVFHNDREVEFIQFKQRLINYFSDFEWAETASCEQIGEEILIWVKNNYPNRKASIKVFEDNENGIEIVEE